jgi:hypothetical protein
MDLIRNPQDWDVDISEILRRVILIERFFGTELASSDHSTSLNAPEISKQVIAESVQEVGAKEVRKVEGKRNDYKPLSQVVSSSRVMVRRPLLRKTSLALPDNESNRRSMNKNR